MENKLSYEQADEIVQGYKDRKDGYSQKLIDAFEGFLHQYVSLLKYGDIDVKVEKMRRFLALFVPKTISSKFNKWKYDPSVKFTIYNKATQLSGLLNRFTEDEIKNQAIVTLLEMAESYKRIDRPTFCYYLNKTFGIYFKKNMEKMIIDPLLCSSWLTYDDQIHSACNINYEKILDRIDINERVSRSSTPTVEDNGDFNFNWINGITADGPFRMLRPIDRQILVLYYIEGMTDDEIAKKLNFGARETVNRRRRKAEGRIGYYGEEHNMLRLREGVQLHNKETPTLRNVCG